MSGDVEDSVPRHGGAGIVTILGEALVLAAAGLVFALAANTLSPRGLSLGHNYFPGATPGVVASPLSTVVADSTNATVAGEAAAALVERIRSRGFQVADRAQAVAWFHDSGYPRAAIVFIDARDRDHYEAGHIPGAHDLDPYRPELEIAAVLPLVQSAETVLIYCNGGDCEDSQFAAALLDQAGIPKERLHIYLGGISDWREQGLPVELGDRNSGTPEGAR